jgi:predicted Zn-dependent protease
MAPRRPTTLAARAVRTTAHAVRTVVISTAITMTAGACGREQPQVPMGDGADAPERVADGLSAREVLDSTDAIEKFLNAGRAREALLVARRFTERAAAGSAAATAAAELRARACFTLSQLGAGEISRAERAALTQEAAEWAVRAVDSSVADGAVAIDAGRVAFAALLASNAGRAADAARLFDRAIAGAPADQSILLQATLSALSAGDPVRARALLARRRGHAPVDASSTVATAAADGWNDALEAEILLVESRFSDAVAAAQRAVARDRDALEFRMILARALRRDGRSADAARLLSALPAAERAKPAIADQFARALAESGDVAGAARAWDECLAANPADAFARAETTLAFHRAGNLARAAAELRALEAMPNAAAEAERVRMELAAVPGAK